MEKAYAQALIQSVSRGKPVHEAVASLAALLKAKGRSELMPRILKSVRRMAEREQINRPRVYVAREQDAKEAFAASGVSEADVVIDESLIGGFRAEDGEVLIDASFKKMLLEMYNRAVAAN